MSNLAHLVEELTEHGRWPAGGLTRGVNSKAGPSFPQLPQCGAPLPILLSMISWLNHQERGRKQPESGWSLETQVHESDGLGFQFIAAALQCKPWIESSIAATSQQESETAGTPNTHVTRRNRGRGIPPSLLPLRNLQSIDNQQIHCLAVPTWHANLFKPQTSRTTWTQYHSSPSPSVHGRARRQRLSKLRSN
jgi:hypothetical protein